MKDSEKSEMQARLEEMLQRVPVPFHDAIDPVKRTPVNGLCSFTEEGACIAVEELKEGGFKLTFMCPLPDNRASYHSFGITQEATEILTELLLKKLTTSPCPPNTPPTSSPSGCSPGGEPETPC